MHTHEGVYSWECDGRCEGKGQHGVIESDRRCQFGWRRGVLAGNDPLKKGQESRDLKDERREEADGG